MRYKINYFLIVILILGFMHLQAQNHLAGVLYKPYINDMPGIGNRWEKPADMKNLKLAYHYLPSGGISWSADYNKALFTLSAYKYKIHSDVVGFSMGSCTRHVFKKVHFSGFLVGVRAGYVTYSIEPEFTDPFGTTYKEYHKKSRLEGSLTLHYFYHLPVASNFYLSAKAGLLLSPQNAGNPLDHVYPDFNWPPFFSPVGGALPWMNIEFNTGVFYRFGAVD